ncbi:hypothetical protein BDZ89DRAFT_1076550 [Hymenopellis radicata]|nr:hypothetical protein BDZ89DRAFT_1076550 [Hymenopellis radicata]
MSASPPKQKSKRAGSLTSASPSTSIMPKSTRLIPESSSSASASPSLPRIGTSQTKQSFKTSNLVLVLVIIIIAYALRACLYKDKVVEPYILPAIRQVQANDAIKSFVAKTKDAGETLYDMVLFPTYDKVVVSLVPVYKRNYPRFRRARKHMIASAGPYVLQAKAYGEAAVAHFRRLESAVYPFVADTILPLLREEYSYMVGLLKQAKGMLKG